MISAAAMSRYAPLFRNLARREVRQRYKGSALGLAWALVTPAIMVAAYSIVFKFLLRIDIPNYALFLFVGLTVWTFFMGGAQVAARSLVSNASLVTKVSFPRQIVPLAVMTGNAFTAAAMFVVALPLCIWLTEGSLAPLVTAAAAGAAAGRLHGRLRAVRGGVQRLLPRRRAHPRGDRDAVDLRVARSSSRSTRCRGSATTGSGRSTCCTGATRSRPSSSASRTRSSGAPGPRPATSLYSAVAAVVMLAVGWSAFRRLDPEMAVEL